MANSTSAPIVVSWSEISSRRACAHKHQLEYVDRWQRKPSLNSALGKGTLFHKVLEQYYLARRAEKSVDEAFQAGQKVLDAVEIKDDFDDEAVMAVQWMYDGYHDRYMGDSLWKILEVEYRFKVRLPTIVAEQPEMWLKGSIDLIARDEQNRLLVIDHKTGASLPRDTTFQLSDQFGLYLWALGQLGFKSFRAMHNAIKTKMNKGDIPGFMDDWAIRKEAGERVGAKPKMQLPDERFLRSHITRMPRELSTLAAEAAATMVKAYMMPRLNERNPNEDYCRFMCSFKEACLEGRRYGRAFELATLKDQGFVQNFVRH